jgi:hypothetical protein
MAVTEKSYVDSQPAVKKAREGLSKARAAYDQAKRALDNTPPNLKDLVKSNAAAVKAAEEAIRKAQEVEKTAASKAASYFKENKSAIIAESEKGKSPEERLAALKESRARAAAAGAPTASYDGLIKDLENQINAPKNDKAKEGAKTGTGAEAETPATLRDYAAEITTAGRAVAKMSDAERLALSTSLKNAGYSVTPSGNYSDQLISAYIQAIADNKIRSTNFNQEIPLQDFLKTRASEGIGAGAAGAGGPEVSVYPTITNKQDGRITINKYFQDKFGRDATNEEFDAAYAKIIAEQKAKPTKRIVSKNAKGENVYETVGGTNTEQILNNFVGSNSKLKSEAATYEASDDKVIQRQKDKKLYETELAKLGGDADKIAALNASTSYGRSIASMQARLARLALEKGGQEFTAEELAQYAKEAIDQSLDTDIESLTSFINSKLKFTPGKDGIYKGAAGQNIDALTKVAAANGIDLQKAFGAQLPDWLNAINKGESIDTYKKMIRDVAKIGMPEKVAKLIDQGVDLSTIYSPYKNLMANTLEINPQSISLDDPTLRSAITAEKEVPLYEFERALRQDNRWQYTNQAKEEVSNATRKILQDFGFMG